MNDEVRKKIKEKWKNHTRKEIMQIMYETARNNELVIDELDKMPHQIKIDRDMRILLRKLNPPTFIQRIKQKFCEHDFEDTYKARFNGKIEVYEKTCRICNYIEDNFPKWK